MTRPESEPPTDHAPAGSAGTSSNVLDEALARVRALDPALAATLVREVDALREGRSFGLVFEKHLPEAVRLPHHPVKRGIQVSMRNTAEHGIGGLPRRVVKISGRGEGREAVLDDGTTQPVEDLVVVRDFGDPVYPGLRSLERIERGQPDEPTHVVINGENHHVLQTLLFTHRKAVDLIYIDPPYNTGNNGWIYNDRYVADQDAFKHSKWLSFMERRLVLARDLLKDTGVIIVAIDDHEHHRLRMLMDQVFGPSNFLADVVWIGSVKNDARFTGGGLDYMLIYARNAGALIDADVAWREPKVGLKDVLDAGARAWEGADRDPDKATRLLSGWWSRNRANYDPGLGDNVKVDTDGTVIKVSDLRSPNPRPNLRYDLLHPVTGEPVRMHPNGWVYSEATMLQLVAEGRVLFGKDHTSGARRKTPLAEMSMQSVGPRFYRDRRASSKRLVQLLGDKRFPYPKDHEVLMRWIGVAGSSDAVILDFFAGSGTTAEAVMRLNAEDGGSRQCLLVTNNEVAERDAKALTKAGHVPGDPEWEAKGVFEYVTRPRLATVVTGVRPDGSTYDDGLGANVEFLEMTYLDEARVQRAKEFEAIEPLLWLRARASGQRIATEPTDGWALTDRYGILVDVDEAEPFVAAVSAGVRDAEAPLELVFVVTDSPSDFAAVAGRLPDGVQVLQLYESYLRNFEINAGAGL